MLKMVDGTGIIGVDMVCPLGGTVFPPQPPNYDKVEMEGVGSLMLPNSLKAPIERLELIGNSTQGENPAPDNPQEIKSAGRFDTASGKYLIDVKVTGKNLVPHVLDFMKFGNNDPKTIVFDEKTNSYKLEMRSDNFNQVMCHVKFKLKKGTYVIRRKIKIEGVDIANPDGLKIVNSDTKEVLYHPVRGISRVFELPKDTNIAINIGHMSGEKQTEAIIYDLQLEEGTVETDYEPYQEPQTLTLTSDRPLTKWDRLVEQGGQYGWLYKHRIVNDLSALVKDSEPIYGKDGEKYFSVSLQGALFNYDYNKIYSVAGLCPKDSKIHYVPKPMMQSVVIYVSDTDTIMTAKEHMHYKVIYETTESQFAPLSESEQTQLRNLHSYNGTTNIMVDSGEVPCGIKLTYRKEK